jgi:hypothetical protein
MNLTWIGLSLALLALILAWSAIRLVRSGRGISAGGAGLLAVAFGALAGLTLGLAITFGAVDRLADESELGTVTLSRLEPGVYMATTDLDGRGPQRYRLAGDHWQLDVRFLRWQLPARLLGADSLYQLDRISGRYAEPSRMAHAELTAYALSDTAGRMMWKLASEAGRRLPWVDAAYGTAVYLPMADGARYRVSVTDTGLTARPDNAAAREASDSW